MAAIITIIATIPTVPRTTGIAIAAAKFMLEFGPGAVVGVGAYCNDMETPGLIARAAF